MTGVAVGGARLQTGILLALVAATSFGTSGAIARGLIEAGWTPAAAVTVRVWIGALALLAPALWQMRGRWHLVRRNLGLLTAYGLIAVAGCQLAYFSAVVHMDVGLALLIEYTAPVAVVLWLWLRHGHRPGGRTAGGALLCGVGLILVLDLLGGATVSFVGVGWALLAMVGAAFYFIVSAHQGNGLPPLALAAGGLVVGALALTLAGAVGVVPLTRTSETVVYAGTPVSWWVAVLALGLVSCAAAYPTGIAATRLLGSRLASFVALSEVVAGLGFAWLLLDQLPRPVQWLGGLLILLGVVVVKLGEPADSDTEEVVTAGVSERPVV